MTACVEIFLLALTAALNPSLLAATTVMLLLPTPRNLMLGYLLGALLTSISVGLLIVFYLQDSGTVTAAKHTLSPATDFVLGFIALAVARALNAERDVLLKERRERHKAAKGKPEKEKEPPRWQRAISRGGARTTFVVGVVLSLPGTSYLLALVSVAKDDLATLPTILIVLGFNLVMLMLLEIPLLAYSLAPETTPEKVEGFKAWLRRDGRLMGIRVATVFGVLMIVHGVLTAIP